MTTLSTHDTKRSEDVRARLSVLAEIPEDWAQRVRAWNDRSRPHRSEFRFGPDRYDTYLLWQTLVGAWPLSADRAVDYLRKAMREAARVTTWTDPNPDYEAASEAFVRAVLADEELNADIAEFVTDLDRPARAVSLGAKLVQLTMPGVPDVYQGGELALYTLVDPDNRAPVDFGREHGPLDALKAEVTGAALRLRREHPDSPAARRLGTRSRSCAAARRSPWPPCCRPAWRPRAAGAARCCHCRRAAGSTR
jgi:(1->4)-alpha-D-glucan 1-alpha-D-glucosylmutase